MVTKRLQRLLKLWLDQIYGLDIAVINGDTAVRRHDGTVRLVVAHQDPDMPNWLDTAGHPGRR